MRRILILVSLCVVGAAVFIVARDRVRGYKDTRGARLVHFTLHSALTHGDRHEILVTPKRHGRTLLLLLHGRGSSPTRILSQPFFDGLAALGKRAPIVLLLDGGDHSYWHDRADGRWGSMVLREAIPAGKRRANALRVAIGGISMGGFGALDLGARGDFCAVGGHSAAVWTSAGATAPGAFDDGADFARHDLIARPPHYRMPVWMDVGTRDPFHDADVALAHKIHAELHVWPGTHEGWYWRLHFAQYLRFYARACG